MGEGKIFISGPISGYNLKEQRKKFAHIEDVLRAIAPECEVFNPLKNGLPEDATYEEHMRADIRALTECDAIVFLQGWEKSQGCRAEIITAVCMGIEVFLDMGREVGVELKALDMRMLNGCGSVDSLRRHDIYMPPIWDYKDCVGIEMVFAFRTGRDVKKDGPFPKSADEE